MEETYLQFVDKGRWAIGRVVNGKWLRLVQDSRLDNPVDAEHALRACTLAVNHSNFDEYFPIHPVRGRCPTLEFLEIFARVGEKIKKEVGV